MKNATLRRILCIVCVLGMLACSIGCGKTTTEPASTNNVGSDAPSLPAAVKDTLYVADVDPQYALDMHDCTQTTVSRITDNICESLLMTLADGSLKPVLLTGMPTISDDNLVYSFELISGIKFHNGAPLTSNDVKYSLTDIALKPSMSSLMEYIEGYDAVVDGTADSLAGIEVQDDTHFTITLNSPYSPFLSVLSTMYCSIYPAEAHAAAGDDWGRGTLYGTGPYMLVSYESGVGVEITRFDDFHGDAPYFKNIVYKFIEDPNTMVLEFKQGNIDYCDLTAALYKTYSADPTVSSQIHSYKAPGGFFGTINTKTIDNADVRHAISISMDRAAICDAIMGGVADPAVSFIPEGIIGRDESYGPYEYNPELAKQLLAGAGYPNGYDLRVTVSSKYPDSVTIVTAWQEQAKACGINITVEDVDNSAWSDMRSAGGIDLAVGNWYVDYNDPDSMLYPIMDSRTDKRSSFWHNAEFKSLCEQGVVETDNAKRQEIYARAEYICTRVDYALMPIYNESKFYLFNPDLKGFEMDSAYRFYFYNACM